MNQIEYCEAKLAFEIDSWDLMEAQKTGGIVVVVDARGPAAYEKEHVQGAVSLPHRRMVPEQTGHLSREPLYVVYCDGIGCNASTQAALKLAKLGFRVKELMGGLEYWKRGGYPTRSGADACDTAGGECGC